jgi:hypothetical protein
MSDVYFEKYRILVTWRNYDICFFFQRHVGGGGIHCFVKFRVFVGSGSVEYSLFCDICQLAVISDAYSTVRLSQSVCTLRSVGGSVTSVAALRWRVSEHRTHNTATAQHMVCTQCAIVSTTPTTAQSILHRGPTPLKPQRCVNSLHRKVAWQTICHTVGHVLYQVCTSTPRVLECWCTGMSACW